MANQVFMATLTSQHKQINIRRTLSYPIKDVWEALTHPEAISDWLMKATGFELQVGQEFLLETKPQGNFDGKIQCKILDFEAERYLSYSWKSNGMKQATIVEWRIKEVGAQETHLTLDHYGFEGINGWLTQKMLSFGWKKLISKKLISYLQNQ